MLPDGRSSVAPGLPVPAEPGATDVHGRGLQIIAALADEWGCQPAPLGKTVWARLDGTQ